MNQPRPAASRTTTVSTADLEWHVRIDGTHSQALLMLHGFTGMLTDWDTVARRLSTRYTVVRPDLPGHGQTRWSGAVAHRPGERAETARVGLPAMEDITRQLTVLMRVLGFEQFACVGYSLGGRTAISLACTTPERVTQLVLESASPGLQSVEERSARALADARLAERIIDGGIESFVLDWEQVPLFLSQQRLSDGARTRQRAIRLAQSPQGMADSLNTMGTGQQPSYWDCLTQLTMPTLLITGGEDKKFSDIARQMEERLGRVKHLVVDAAGHNVHLEQPQLFLAAVDDFLFAHLPTTERSNE